MKKKKKRLLCLLNHNIHNTNDDLGPQIVLNKFNVHFLIPQVSVEALNQKSHVPFTASGQVKSHYQH